MKVWLARDLSGELWLYEQKPIKTMRYFLKTDGKVYKLDKALYPELTYKDSPKQLEVRL